jgi:hypothetical protein
MNLKIVYVVFFCFCAIFLWGCAELPQKSQNTINPALLEPQAVAKFSDVPVPVGFKPVPQESYSFESGGVRVGLLKYQGKASVDQVVNFYKEQMAMNDWNLINIIEYGQRLMNFEREAETCSIGLIPKGSSTVITLSIGPKAQQVPKRSAKVVK